MYNTTNQIKNCSFWCLCVLAYQYQSIWFVNHLILWWYDMKFYVLWFLWFLCLYCSFVALQWNQWMQSCGTVSEALDTPNSCTESRVQMQFPRLRLRLFRSSLLYTDSNRLNPTEPTSLRWFAEVREGSKIESHSQSKSHSCPAREYALTHSVLNFELIMRWSMIWYDMWSNK